MAVESVLIINNYGKPRLATFYHSIPPAQQQLLIRTIFKLVSSRPDGDVCNFLDAPELDPLLQTGRPGDTTKSKSRSRGEKGEGSSSISSAQERRVIYRHYATLWFVFVVDQSESELGILDLIQVSEGRQMADKTSPAAADDSCCAMTRSLSSLWTASSRMSASLISYSTTKRSMRSWRKSFRAGWSLRRISAR